jgi:hypothetical protein
MTSASSCVSGKTVPLDDISSAERVIEGIEWDNSGGNAGVIETGLHTPFQSRLLEFLERQSTGKEQWVK